MVSIGKLMHAEQVVRYMVEATTDTRAAYYTTRDDTAGRWTGRAAEWLQLCGEVSGEQLTSLLHGRNPHSGAELMQRRWASQSIVAFDVTFSVPKSVSARMILRPSHDRTRYPCRSCLVWPCLCPTR